jgi:membrane protein YdbS with pleckstrin-like domain
MPMNKPSQKTLTVWRARLTLLAFVPAFALSLRYDAGSFAWRVFAGVFVFAFAGAYLFYLPARLKSRSHARHNGMLIVKRGVFYRRTAAMPQDAVQTVAVSAGPLCRKLGLACVIVSAAGFRVRVPGLPLEQAKKLAEELSP